MQQNYTVFIDRVIQKYEGGYGFDRSDPGGPTNFGITCYDLAEHQGKKMNSMAEWASIVRSMSLATAEEIYANKYAKRDRFNELNTGPDCVILDYGINSGIYRPVWIAQRLLGRAKTNVFDDDLLKAINAIDPVKFVNQMCDERLRFLQGLRIWPKFKGGWSARVADLRTYCSRLAQPNLKGLPPESHEPIPRTPKGMVHEEAEALILGTH